MATKQRRAPPPWDGTERRKDGTAAERRERIAALQCQYEAERARIALRSRTASDEKTGAPLASGRKQPTEVPFERRRKGEGIRRVSRRKRVTTAAIGPLPASRIFERLCESFTDRERLNQVHPDM